VYPGGETHGFTFDAMGRVSGMGGVGSISYGAAGQITGLDYFGMSETRTYNSLLQMTRQTVTQGAGTVLDMEYVFTAGANDGRITSSVDHVLGETVNYTYDSLQRLSRAETAGTGGWGQAFGYDGFGNLTSKTPTKGSVPVLSVQYDASNHLVGGSYDGNGNEMNGVYDVENRMVIWQGWQMRYDHRGKRVFKERDGTHEYTVYGFGGQKLRTETCVDQEGGGVYCTGSNHVYWGGKLVKSRGVVAATDRLGSVRWNGNGETFAYYPYGEERGSSADGREKFGTYERDWPYDDYADQRYYRVGTGRFGTPDPYMASGGPADPGSWNRYAYVQGDPINSYDPTGLLQWAPGAYDAPFYVVPGYDSWSAQGTNFFWYDPMQDARGGGGGGFIHVGNPSKTGPNEQRIRTVLDWINGNIDADCAGWLSGVGDAIAGLEGDASNLDTVLIGHGTMNVGVSAFTGNNVSQTDLPPGYAITVNDAGAFFVGSYTNSSGQTMTLSANGYAGGTSQAQVAILLHELAHFVGAAGFQSNFENSAAGKRNDALVKQHCKDTLNAAKKIP
jgi:RHS repeat-associated protein